MPSSVSWERGSTGGIQSSQKKPPCQCACEFSNSEIFSLDFSFKTMESTLNAHLPHMLWAHSGCWGTMRTTQGVTFALSLTLWSCSHLGMMNV